MTSQTGLRIPENLLSTSQDVHEISSILSWSSDALHRVLQDDSHRGRMILTILYLVVLGLCFVVPIFYYFRMHCEDRYARRIHELEVAGVAEALERSQSVHREESRAARRKYREERKARIVQLFAPVRMVLAEENFPHLRGKSGGTDVTVNRARPDSSAGDSEADAEDAAATQNTARKDIPVKSIKDASTKSSKDISMKSVDEDQLFVEVPAPGFQYSSARLLLTQKKQRLVPNVCTICLCNYYPGDAVIWSSNEACEHAFHEGCILQWILKQREGPLCPCCRRDFVLDPYDLEEEEVDNNWLRPADSGDSSDYDTTPHIPTNMMRVEEEAVVDIEAIAPVDNSVDDVSSDAPSVPVETAEVDLEDGRIVTDG